VPTANATTQPTATATQLPTATPPATPTSAPTSQPTDTPAAAIVLLEVTQEGGFIAPSARLGQTPTVVVDSAGNIYTADPNAVTPTLIHPVVVRAVGANGAVAILAAMRAAGLDKQGSDPGIVADSGVTVFTAEIDGQEVVNRVGSGGAPGPGHPGQSPNPAIDLLNRLLDPTETWGATNVSNVPFSPTAYKLYVAPAAAGAGSVAWPLTTDLANFGSPATPDFGVTGLRTGVIAGTDTSILATALATATPETVVTSNGKTYQVWIRPLLPPELSQ